MVHLPAPVLGTWTGNVVAGAALTAYLAWREGPASLLRWRRAGLPWLAGGSLLITVAYVLFLVGVGARGVALTSALAATEPLAALFASLLVWRRHAGISPWAALGVVATVGGVAAVLLAGG